MAILNQAANLNLIPGTSAQTVVHLSQGNVGDTLTFYLYSGSVPFSGTGVAVALNGIRKDGTGFTAPCIIVGNVVTVTVTESMTALEGYALAELVLTGGGASVGTANFVLAIEDGTFPNGPTYDTDISVYQQILQYVQSYPAIDQARIDAAVNAEKTARQAAITAIQTDVEEIQTDVEELANTSDEFRGKHLLIVGDSWTAGYNGSGSTVGWTPTFINLLGCTADVDYESGAGFIRESQQNGALHPGETLVDVLDHYQDNDYYAIIVQCGVNDINYSSSVDDLASGIANFAAKCRTYWPNAKIIYFPTYARHYIAIDRQQYAIILVNSAINSGMDVCRNCLNWALFGSDTVKGNDNSHLSLDGYVQLGKWAAAYCNGWDGGYINSDITYQSDGLKQSYAFNVAWETAGNVHPTYTKTLYVRVNGDMVGILASFVVNTSATSGSIAIITGLPIEKASGGIFLDARVANVSVIAPRAYISGGTLYLEIFGNQDLNAMRVQVTGHYHSRQNAF